MSKISTRFYNDHEVRVVCKIEFFQMLILNKKITAYSNITNMQNVK